MKKFCLFTLACLSLAFIQNVYAHPDHDMQTQDITQGAEELPSEDETSNTMPIQQ